MPGFLLHVGATVQCAHQGQAQPTQPNPKVMVAKQSVVTQSCVYSVAGCTLQPPGAGNGPCVTATWITAAVKVLANKVPVLLADSQSTCTPTGTPLTIVNTQVKVKGT